MMESFLSLPLKVKHNSDNEVYLEDSSENKLITVTIPTDIVSNTHEISRVKSALAEAGGVILASMELQLTKK